MRQLLARASQYGISVHGVEMKGGKLGRFVPRLRRIYFEISLPLAERRSVIAHELGHAHYGHDCTTPSSERQANTYAATLLVDPEWYAELESINHDAEWIADEMNVAPYVIIDYRHLCLQRIGHSTYTRPRMGVGQWLHRALAG